MKLLKLIPVAQIRPNSKMVESPSRIRPSVEVSESEFKSDYTPSKGLVSFEKDGVSNPVTVTKYTGKNGLWGRFIKAK
jgi:hypothetical protein